jgi:large subunit ribosomal protein L29
MNNKDLFNKLQNMTQSEILIKLNNLNNKVAKLKMYNSVISLKNPLYIRTIRREIARIKTYLHIQRTVQSSKLELQGENKVDART